MRSGSLTLLTLPIKVAGQRYEASPPPALGADTDVVLAELNGERR